jgi:hypothetical protein
MNGQQKLTIDLCALCDRSLAEQARNETVLTTGIFPAGGTVMRIRSRLPAVSCLLRKNSMRMLPTWVFSDMLSSLQVHSTQFPMF